MIDDLTVPGRMMQACQLAAQVAEESGVRVRPYQVEALGRTLASNMMLNLSMGGGKTLVATMAARDVDTTLIVCPLVTRSIWHKELWRGARATEVIELRGTKRLTATRIHLDGGVPVHEEELGQQGALGRFVMTTPESVGPWADTMRRSFGLVVADEAHRYGGRSSKRTHGLRRYAKLAGKLCFLSGTPDLGGTHRLWTPLNLLAPFAFPGYWSFVKEFCGAKENGWGGMDIGRGSPEALEKLRARMAPWVLTYGDDIISPYLPENTIDRVMVQLSGPQAKVIGGKLSAAMKALRELGAGRVADFEGDSVLRCTDTRFLPGEVVEARLACARAKLPSVAEMATELHEAGEHVVVWAWHKTICRELAVELQRGTIPVYEVYGNLPQAGVDASIVAWTQRGGVLIATMAKLGEGEDRLVAARWQIFLELDWLPQTMRQAMGRLVRMSQTRKVQTRFMELSLPFERSLVDRVMARAEDSDRLWGVESSVKTPVIEDLLQRMGDRLAT